MIYRCYNCKYINIENSSSKCPLCDSNNCFIFLNSPVDLLKPEILQHVYRMNLKAKQNHALWDKKGMELILDPYRFYIEKSDDKEYYVIYDSNRQFINVFNAVNNKSVQGTAMRLYEPEIQFTIMRLIFFGVNIDKVILNGEKITEHPAVWKADITKKNMRLVLRNVRYQKSRKQLKTGIYDMIVNPKLLAYLEIFYNQGLLYSSEFIRRQKMLLELIDLYKDYSKWEEECDDLLDSCLSMIEDVVKFKKRRKKERAKYKEQYKFDYK